MSRAEDREIVRLAVPAFLALVAEPLFLLSDAAIVGHLGTEPLAGLGIAAVVLQTIVGLCVFLAYGTTASVARHLGAGDTRGALAQGVDGLWLAVLIGAVATVGGVLLTDPLVGAFGAGPAVTEQAATYLRIALLGTTPLLIMLAATGVLRGLQDTRTPLYVAVGGNALNIVLNVTLVYGADLGIAGSAWGSVLAQVASAAALVAVVVRAARTAGAPLRPDRPGIVAAARAGVPLVIRTLTLRAALLVTTYAVTIGAATGRDQAVDLATHQLAFTIWIFLAFVLDAIAIAAQALTGRYLGAGDVAGTRRVTDRMVRWGLWSGVVTGVLLAALSPLLGRLFTDDGAVQERLVAVLLVAAVGQPVAGVVFVLDGVLIGAGDGRFLAWGGLLTLAVYAPAALLSVAAGGGLLTVWIAFTVVFMGARLVVLARPRPRRRVAGHRDCRAGAVAEPRVTPCAPSSWSPPGLVLMLFDFNIGEPADRRGPRPRRVGHHVRRRPRLSSAFPFRTLLLALAAVSGVLSLLLWVPGLADGLRTAETSVLWALDLPPMAFVGTLAVGMMRAAYEGGDFSARGWWRAVLAGLVMTVLLPILVYGGGSAGLVILAVTLALVTLITCVVLCLVHAKRPWVDGPAAAVG